MKKKIVKNIPVIVSPSINLIKEFLDFWPLTIVVPLMLIGIVLGAALGWGG